MIIELHVNLDLIAALMWVCGNNHLYLTKWWIVDLCWMCMCTVCYIYRAYCVGKVYERYEKRGQFSVTFQLFTYVYIWDFQKYSTVGIIGPRFVPKIKWKRSGLFNRIDERTNFPQQSTKIAKQHWMSHFFIEMRG